MELGSLVKTYVAYGKVIRSGIALPLPPASEDTLTDLVIEVGDVDVQGLELRRLGDANPAAEDQETVLFGWDDRRVVVVFDTLTAELDLVGGRSIRVQPGTDDEGWNAHLLLDHVVPRWVALSGDLVLHASCVVVPGEGAVALVGETGAGKSTTALALAQTGLMMATDDSCRLIADGRHFLAVPSYRAVRLTGQSRGMLLAAGAPSVPVADGADKHWVEPVVPWAAEPTRLVAVLLLERGPGPLALSPMSLMDGISTVMRHGFHLAEDRRTVAVRAFEEASALCQAVPVTRLRVPWGWDVYDELREVLAAHLTLDG